MRTSARARIHDEDGRVRWFVPLVVAISMLTAAVALAADQPDFAPGDSVEGTTLDFGEVCPGDELTESVQVRIRQQNANKNNNYANGAEVTMTRGSIEQAVGDVGTLSAPAEVGKITLPGNWNTDRDTELKVSDAVASAVTLVVPSDAASGSYSGKIQYRGVGPEADPDDLSEATGDDLTRSRDLDVTWDVLEATDEACDDAGYTLDGFYQPVDNTQVNGAKAGRVIPLKFNILDADGVKQDDTSLVQVFVMRTACNGGVEHNLLEEDSTSAAGKTELRWDPDGEQMVFNWKTPKAAGCYRIVLEVQGDALSVDFDLR